MNNSLCPRAVKGGGSSLIVLAVLLSCPAAAEAAQSDSEIVVTAQKREQKLQDVAGSITALGSEQLEDAGLGSVADITARVPGVDFGFSLGGSFVTIRGIGVGVDTGVAEPNTAIYVDGIYLPRTTIQQLNPIDLERVEVLRGPQGTLYGRNATAGAINFISQAPTEELSGTVRASYGNFQTVDLGLRVSGPLAPSVRASVSAGYYDRAKGYMDNLFTGGTFDKSERLNLRGAVQIDLTETITLDASLSYEREIFQTVNSLIRAPSPLTPILVPVPIVSAPFAPWTLGSNYNPNSRRSTLMARVQLNWEISPNVSFRSITGYIDHKFRNNADADGMSADFSSTKNRIQPSESVSQEFNLSGVLPNNGSWIVGAYVFHEDSVSNYPVDFPSGFPAFGLPAGAELTYNLGEKTLALAAFTDVTVGLSENFRVYGGVRLSRDEKDSTQTVGVRFPGTAIPPVLQCQDLVTRQVFNSLNPRVGAQYDASQDVMLYAQYSQGFKSGGINSAACNGAYDPERLKAFEAGFKSELFDRKLTFNASMFHYKYDGFQLLQIVGVAAAIANADTRVYGAEVEAALRIGDNWRIDASGTWLDAKFTNFMNLDSSNPGAGVQDLKGERTPRAPKYSANLGIEGRFPFEAGPFTSLSLRADARFSGNLYLQAFNTAVFEQKAYAILDLNAVLAADDAGVKIRGYMRNVTNKAVLAHAAYNVTADTFFGGWRQPRTYGIEIIKTF